MRKNEKKTVFLSNEHNFLFQKNTRIKIVKSIVSFVGEREDSESSAQWVYSCTELTADDPPILPSFSFDQQQQVSWHSDNSHFYSDSCDSSVENVNLVNQLSTVMRRAV